LTGLNIAASGGVDLQTVSVLDPSKTINGYIYHMLPADYM